MGGPLASYSYPYSSTYSSSSLPSYRTFSPSYGLFTSLEPLYTLDCMSPNARFRWQGWADGQAYVCYHCLGEDSFLATPLGLVFDLGDLVTHLGFL
jgi:hypothetical protein